MALGERQSENPLVGVIMGSDSDLPKMQPASDVLNEFGVEHETRVVSAHRTPARMMEYGRVAVGRGLKVIIAGAGGSAHLPGMVASETRLPVLGVAIEGTTDSLASAVGSMVYMPKGKPLAFMGRNETGAYNAGLEAVRILALQDPELAETYEAYDARMATQVEEIDAALLALGPEAYLQR